MVLAHGRHSEERREKNKHADEKYVQCISLAEECRGKCSRCNAGNCRFHGEGEESVHGRVKDWVEARPSSGDNNCCDSERVWPGIAYEGSNFKIAIYS